MHSIISGAVRRPSRPYGADMGRRREHLDPELATVARERLDRALGRPVERGGRHFPDPAPPTKPRRARAAVLEDERDLAGEWEADPASAVGRGLDPGWKFGSAAEFDHVRPASVGLEDLAPSRRFTRWHLGVVVGLVLLGLLWGGWSLLRARPVAIATPTLSAAVPPGATSPAPGPSSTPTPARIVVHVLGAVRRPGLVSLAEPARVQDAIDAAGGLVRGADPGELNLAQPLADGEQVLIGKKGHATSQVRGEGSGPNSGPARGSSNGAGSGSGSGAPVDLNRATPTQLEALPGIGPVTAAKIVAWRDQHGRFNRPDELQEVDGIGPKTYAQIAPHVRV